MPRRPFDIVLIVADTYRQDNAGRAAADPAGSSFFRRLRPFHWFPRCFSSAPWTLPACSSILSGVDSSTHGYFLHSAPFGFPTIGRYLKDDFHRMAVVNNGNLREFTGFPNDFDEYHYLTGHDAPFAKARELWKAGSPQKPRFLFFHTNVPHDYYLTVSRGYYEEEHPGGHDWFLVGGRVGTWKGLSADQRRTIRPIYDSSTRNMEERLGELLDAIDLERTIVCFVADHGEGFDYEQARVHHGGRLHDDLLRVPLLIRLPETFDRDGHDRLAAAQGFACSSSDIVPTLLELAGYEPPSAIDGRSLLGASSRNNGRRLVSEDRRYLYKPNRERLNVNFGGKNTNSWTRLKNMVAQRLLLDGFNIKSYVRYPNKLIVTSLAQSPGPLPRPLASPLLNRMFFSRDPLLRVGNLVLSLELFDLENDPGETRNLLRDLPRDRIREPIGDRIGGLSDLQVSAGRKTATLEAALGS
jgi:arylsulfatase A-like enzyme